jgi:hypothetical protein
MEQRSGMKAYRAFFDEYLPGSDVGDTNYMTGYQQGLILEQILKAVRAMICRAENIVKQAKSLKDLVLPTFDAGHLDQYQRDQQHGLDATATAALESAATGSSSARCST